MRATRNAVTIAALFMLGACVSVGRIQQSEPVRTTKFTGSPKAVADCIQQRLGGKIQYEGYGDRAVIYDSVKNMREQGLTHYAITVAKTGPDQGVVEWRIQRPVDTSGPSAKETPLTPSAVGRIWAPAEECAARAKSLK